MSIEDPIYNIGVVSRMTEIPPATLRIWERRYGFPKATRTEGRHRLYSEAEVQRLRWVKSRIDEGMQTRQAIKALETMEDEGRLTVIAQPIAVTTLPEPDLRQPGEDSYIHILQKRLYQSLVALNTNQADQILNEAQALYPREDVILSLIQPVLFQIGEAWERDEIQIATEHFASHYLRHWLLIWMRTGPPAYEVSPTILACPPYEQHEGGLLMFGALLRRRRWPVAYLGLSTPLDDLAVFVEKNSPLAIVFVAMLEKSAKALLEWPQYFPDAARTGVPVIGYGGRIFNQNPEWRAKVPGVFLGASLKEGVDTLERILRNAVSL